jgi:hypothetical protein
MTHGCGVHDKWVLKNSHYPNYHTHTEPTLGEVVSLIRGGSMLTVGLHWRVKDQVRGLLIEVVVC